jgi:hypothetical protein
MRIGSVVVEIAAVMAFGIATLPEVSLAAGKRGTRDVSEVRGSPSDTALGPHINYPRRPRHFSSSSERYYTGGQVNSIPFRSPGEALEIVPGLAVGR